MNTELILGNIIVPALIAINKYSESAADLVLFTGAVESKYQHVRQVGGPALSWFQIEPKTHDDIWQNYLAFRPELTKGLTQLSNRLGMARELEVNPWYAAAMCRICYLRDRQKLPQYENRLEQAEYWKRVYNTEKGKGTVGKALEIAYEVLG